MARKTKARKLDELRYEYKDMWEWLSWYQYSEMMIHELDKYSDDHIAIYFFGDVNATEEENVEYHKKIIREQSKKIREFEEEIRYQFNEDEVDFILHG